MNFITDKNGVWINNENPTLIWEEDLTEDMEVIDLTLTPVNSDLYYSLKESITVEKHDSYYNTIFADGQDQEIRQQVIDEKYDEYYQQVMEDETIIDKEAAINSLIEQETNRRIEAYVEQCIDQDVDSEISRIKLENSRKSTMLAQTKPVAIETELIENVIPEDKFLKSINYLPDFLQDKPVFKDATKLLDVLISDSTEEDLKVIYEAYCDTLYKWPGYQRLSYEARVTLLQEKGFGYILDLLQHMYDEDYDKEVQKYNAGEITEIDSYDDYVKKRTDKALANITMLFNLLYVLKGKTLGLELALDLTGLEGFTYIPWDITTSQDRIFEWEGTYESLPLPGSDVEVKKGDCYYIVTGDTKTNYLFNGVSWQIIADPDDYKRKREQFTAILDVYGLENNTHREALQRRLRDFVRNYMLPYIEVTVRYTHNVEPLKITPSAGKSLLNMLLLEDYYKDGEHIQKNLTHKVSDERWYSSRNFEREQINFGEPSFSDRSYDGNVILSKSYVQDKDGTKHYLYGDIPTFSNFVSGTAMPKATDEGIINNYDGDFLQVPIYKTIVVDIETGEQNNPYWDNGIFYRDSVIKFYQCLTIEGIHLAKTIEQMEEILIEDFEKEYEESEVYLGRTTSLELESGYNHDRDIKTKTINEVTPILLGIGYTQETIDEYLALCDDMEDATLYQRNRIQAKINALLESYPRLVELTTIPQFFEFETTPYDTREYTGDEISYLKFCEPVLDGNYTGIGDLGILGSNDYFIYNGMLMYHGDILRQIGEDKTWTDVGASHAVSDTYYTPAINNGDLKILFNHELVDVSRSDDLTVYEVHTLTHERILVDNMEQDKENQELENEVIRTFEETWYEIDEAYWNEVESTEWEAITGYINEYYTAFGICQGRLYKIFLENGNIYYELMDNEQGWTYITGADYSDTYEAYGIKNEKLYRISSDGFTEFLDPDALTLEGIENVTYDYANHSFTYENGISEDTISWEDTEDSKTIKFNNVECEIISVSGDETITYHTDTISLEFANNRLVSATINNDDYSCYIKFKVKKVLSFTLKQNQELTGWDSSFDCISRYHHSNDDYTTYGICDGKLYGITNETIFKLDDTKIWTHICGFYNDNSPRTFAYAISNGVLYEIQGRNPEDIIVKDNTRVWSDIHGCTTSTVTFILGLAEGKIYKINAKDTTPELLDNRSDWTKIFGRCTTSTSASQNCWGYAVRNNKLYNIAKDGISIISGFWKVNGTGAIVDLEDFNISNIKCNLPDGNILYTTQDIKENAVYTDTVLTDYDIHVDYITKGFNNNERYQIKTDISEINYEYIHPEDCRAAVHETNRDLFDIDHGTISGFVTKNVQINGTDTITGDGRAYRFVETSTYLTLPIVENLNEVFIKARCILDDELSPIVLDENNKSGIFYGKNNTEYGIFVKHDLNGTPAYTRLVSGDLGDDLTVDIKFTMSGQYCNVSIKKDIWNNWNYSANDYVYIPKYLGGNGIIFGDSTIYLLDSYVKGDEKIYLFTNGDYISVNTLNQDVIYNLITENTQDLQKVIQLHNNNTDIELRMDELYSMLEIDNTTEDLDISTDYNESIQHDPYEGITYSTLNYVGAFVLDPEKIKSNIPLNMVCDFDNTGIASNMNGNNKVHFTLSTDVTDSINFITGDVIESHTVLYRTEESEAYTNDYLLKSDISAVADIDLHTVASGIIYDLNTNLPGTVRRTLVYNNVYFEIDDNKIYNYGEYWFDSYNALLNLQPIYYYDLNTPIYSDQGCSIILDLEGETINNVKHSTYDFKLNSNTDEEQKAFTLDTEVFNSTISGEQYYNLDITQTFVDINHNRVTEVKPAVIPEPKDDLQYDDGKCWNYSEQCYHTLNLNNAKELVLCLKTDDDTSKDQGILGGLNKASFCIKDNEWAYVNDEGEITKSGITAWDKSVTYIRFYNNGSNLNNCNIYISNTGRDWQLIFENAKIYNMLGYANTDSGMLPYNGIVDLAKSYITSSQKERLYQMTQETIVSISSNGEDYNEIRTINTDYTIDELIVGYEFTGTLDMYYSKLLKSYACQWVYNRMDLDTAIKNEMRQADPTYNPDLDPNTYTIEEYGIHPESEPKRWDTITVTYTTVDKAFYMQPNTEYTVRMEVEDDGESGKALVNIVDNPTWNNGVVSNFDNGYCYFNFTNEQYIVLKVNLNGNNQAICGYVDEDELDVTAQCIFTEDNKVKYFDNINTHNLFDIEQNTYYLKLYTTSHNIEYSKDGVNFISTGVETSFTGYERFALGTGFINEELKPFQGSIDLTQSYTFTAIKNDLFVYYKKVTPYITHEGVEYPLTLEPLLTIGDTVTFLEHINGTIDLNQNNLCLPNTRYWEAKRVDIYENDVLIDSVIRDDIEIDPDTQTKVIVEHVQINPEDLHVFVNSTPLIGSQIKLTYNSWYLFRKKNTEYNFNVKMVGDKTIISYNEPNKKEYLIVILPKQDFDVNFGYEFNGTLNCVNSTRGGMMLCDYLVWYTYSVYYKKNSEENWTLWTEWIKERANLIYERIGFDLKGTHYLETSYVQTRDITTPFITFFDPDYIKVVGSVSFSPDRTGTVTRFTDDDYLSMVMDKLEEGSRISFWITTGSNISNQGVSTFVKMKGGYFVATDSTETILGKLRPNYTYIVEYIFGSSAMTVGMVDNMTIKNLEQVLIKEFEDAHNKVLVRILGYNVGPGYTVPKGKENTVTIIPYNPNKREDETGYYITNSDQASKVKIYYRKAIPGDYDHFTKEGDVTWYEANLEKSEIDYFGERLNVYHITVPFGYNNEINSNNNIDYYVGDMIEFKIESETISYNTVIPYNTLMLKQRAVF